jgi:nucleoid DNA-binding protein/nucleoid-associated protein YgaU
MNIKLTLQEIIDKLSEQSGQSKKISENFLRILIDVIEEGLKKDGIAKVKGLGTFKIISIEQRKSVNVQDGSEYIIPAHNKISFTPEKTIKEEINRPYSHLETYTLSDDAPVMVTPDDEDDDNLIETSNDDKEENSSVEEFIPSIEEESKEIKNSTAVEEKIESSSENILEKEENKLGVETKESTQIVEEIFHEEKTFIKETINNNIMEEKKDNIELAEEINNDVTDEANEMSTNENEVKEEVIEEANNESMLTDEEKIAEEPIAKEIEQKTSSSTEEEIVEEDEKPKNKTSKFIFILLLLALLAAVAYFALNHFNLLGDNAQDEMNNSLPPQELVENESPESVAETTEDDEELFFAEEGVEGDIMDVEELQNPEESTEAEFEESVSEEPIVEDAAETKTFDSELVNFMNENYPGMNFPSSCPVKNEVTMTNGNRLTLVSLKNLGHKNFWVYIYYFNRDIISNPNNVPIGAKIKIPDLNPSITNPDSEECMSAVSNINQKLINK